MVKVPAAMSGATALSRERRGLLRTLVDLAGVGDRQLHRVATVGPVLPAVTTTVQSTYLTGKYPSEHGSVANGWYFRDLAEVMFWRQSNRLVQAAKVWDLARQNEPDFTCANVCWWFNMYSSVDFAVTPPWQKRVWSDPEYGGTD
mgnify:CR=1 FL=1